MKRSIQPKKVLGDLDVVTFLKDLHSNSVLLPMGKGSNNIVIVCKKILHNQSLLKFKRL